jgi:hypothetical protein
MFLGSREVWRVAPRVHLLFLMPANAQRKPFTVQYPASMNIAVD